MATAEELEKHIEEAVKMEILSDAEQEDGGDAVVQEADEAKSVGSRQDLPPVSWNDSRGKKRGGWFNKAQTVMWHVDRGEIDIAMELSRRWRCRQSD